MADSCEAEKSTYILAIFSILEQEYGVRRSAFDLGGCKLVTSVNEFVSSENNALHISRRKQSIEPRAIYILIEKDMPQRSVFFPTTEGSTVP